MHVIVPVQWDLHSWLLSCWWVRWSRGSTDTAQCTSRHKGTTTCIDTYTCYMCTCICRADIYTYPHTCTCIIFMWICAYTCTVYMYMYIMANIICKDFKSELTWKSSPSHRWTHEHVARKCGKRRMTRLGANKGLLNRAPYYMYTYAWLNEPTVPVTLNDLPLLLQWLHQVVAQTALLPEAFREKTRSQPWEAYSLYRCQSFN